MGDGEYNNLGQYMVKDKTGRTFQIGGKVLSLSGDSEFQIDSEIIHRSPRITGENITVGFAGTGIKELVKALKNLRHTFQRTKNATKRLALVRTQYYKILQANKSNNWLKMHGFPMRRKVRR